MQRVIEVFIPEMVTPHLRKAAAAEVGICPWEVWGNPNGVADFNRLLRRSLFVGLSDGSHIDILRRANSPRLVQDQFVPMLDIGDEKWPDLGKELSSSLGQDARFDNVYLIDDFTASGTTFIRQVDGKWKRKLKKFNDLVVKARESLQERFPISDSYALHIHHYVSAEQARAALEERVGYAKANLDNRSFEEVTITEGLRLPTSLKMIGGADAAMLDLCERYYNDHLYQRLRSTATRPDRAT